MPPRYAYWTIIAGGLPTAFRAARRDELMPTFTRIREKHPDAEMKWFARGRLWESPEAARQAGDGRSRQGPARGAAGRGSHSQEGRAGAEARGRDWRPGGEHRDPRQKFKDAKKARNLDWRRDKFARRQQDERRAERQGGPGSRPRPPKREWTAREGGTRDWKQPRQGGPASRPAPPKRAWTVPREGGTRDRKQPREGGPATPKRPWHSSREGGSRRPFSPRGFARNQGTEEPTPPPRPRGPNREPRPSETPKPSPPPRPSEPVIPPPGPPERGRPRRPKRRP